jgi:hypothetical protein
MGEAQEVERFRIVVVVIAIVDRHFALLLSSDRLHGAAVPQRRCGTAGVSLD